MIFSGENKIKAIYSGGNIISKVYQDNIEIWKNDDEQLPDYLCFTNTGTTDAILKLTKVGDAPAVVLEKSIDGVNFEPWDLTDITLAPNDKVYFHAGSEGNNTFATSTGTYNKFAVTPSQSYVDVSGDMTTLLTLNGNLLDLTGRDFCFYRLFEYGYWFRNFDIKLPSTILSDHCYNQMFAGCTRACYHSLELPAVTLTTKCYNYMFQFALENFGNLTVHFKDWNVGGNSTTGWWDYAQDKVTGTFYCPPELGNNETIQRGTNYCPQYMTVINI